MTFGLCASEVCTECAVESVLEQGGNDTKAVSVNECALLLYAHTMPHRNGADYFLSISHTFHLLLRMFSFWMAKPQVSKRSPPLTSGSRVCVAD